MRAAISPAALTKSLLSGSLRLACLFRLRLLRESQTIQDVLNDEHTRRPPIFCQGDHAQYQLLQAWIVDRERLEEKRIVRRINPGQHLVQRCPKAINV